VNIGRDRSKDRKCRDVKFPNLRDLINNTRRQLRDYYDLIIIIGRAESSLSLVCVYGTYSFTRNTFRTIVDNFSRTTKNWAPKTRAGRNGSPDQKFNGIYRRRSICIPGNRTPRVRRFQERSTRRVVRQIPAGTRRSNSATAPLGRFEPNSPRRYDSILLSFFRLVVGLRANRSGPASAECLRAVRFGVRRTRIFVQSVARRQPNGYNSYFKRVAYDETEPIRPEKRIVFVPAVSAGVRGKRARADVYLIRRLVFSTL